MIPFLSDTPAPASALLSGPMPAQSAELGGTALDFAGLLGAALVPEAGAVGTATALPAATPEAPTLAGADNAALALPPLHPATTGKALPLPGAELPLPVTDDPSALPTLPAPVEAKPTRALVTRDGMVTASPRAVVPVAWLQEGTAADPAQGVAETVAQSGAEAAPDTADPSPDTQAPAAPVRADDPRIPPSETTNSVALMPLAPPEPTTDTGESDTAEADAASSAPSPLPAPALSVLPAAAASPAPAPLAAAVPPRSVTVEVQARPIALARNAAAPVRAATPPVSASPAPTEDAPSPATPSAATAIEALAEAPAPSAPAPGQPSPALTLAAVSQMPAAPSERTDAPRAAAPAPQLEQAIDQVGTLREAMRTARPEMTVRHAEFGFVSLRLEQPAPEQWRAVLASRDPGFVPAIQLALAERAVAASADSAPSTSHHGGSQNGTGDQRYGASPNGGQGGSQPYLGQSGQRDGEAAPDHRRPSTAAALAARAEEEGEAAASPGHHARGTFA